MSARMLIDDIGEIDFVRNPRSKKVKLRINHDGQAEVTAPPYVPVFVIKKFVSSKSDWIKKHQKPKSIITEGMKIGRGHIVTVVPGKKFSIRNINAEIRVTLTPSQKLTDKDVQTRLELVAIESLRKQAKSNFPTRVKAWNNKGVGSYNNVKIKLIRSRWGSYSSDGNINLSLFMAQLPDDLIDYVIVHELSHSVHMNHSAKFWDHVGKFLPNYKELRKQLRTYNMRVNAK